jgi:hypothetical protein
MGFNENRKGVKMTGVLNYTDDGKYILEKSEKYGSIGYVGTDLYGR